MQAQAWLARRFDGQQLQACWVQLRPDPQLACLHLHPSGERIDVATLDGDADGRLLQLPDRSTLQIEGELRTWCEALRTCGWRESPVQRWKASWLAAVLALLLAGGLLLGLDRVGLPWLGESLARWTPAAWQDRLGQLILESLCRTELQADELQTETWRTTQAKLSERLARVEPTLKFSLHAYANRGAPQLNAFALPGGHVLVLEGMLQQLNDEQLLAVLAHELGHLHHQHTMRGVGHAVGLTVVASLAFGDFSSVGAGLAGGLGFARHSRASETQADDYAVELLKRMGVRPVRLAEAFEVLQSTRRAKYRGVEPPPEWMSSHPDLEQRIARARQADAAWVKP